MIGSDVIVDECRGFVKEHPAVDPVSRRGFLKIALASPAGLALATSGLADGASPMDVHQQLLDLAARQEAERRARFAAIASKADLDALQASLRATFLRLLDGFPEKTGTPPPVQKMGTIEADDYVVEKLAYESFSGYFVPALLYKPRRITSPRPGVLSPCGHSTNGKAASAYQILHINLAKRGYVVLTHDPVGQGERSQFWDAGRGRSRINLSCGEHAVLGNPLYLLGTSLARYRIWDGMRGLDYLTSRAEVDPKRIGCVGNSGGGTLTAYIAALDPRVTVAAIGCYITTLRRRMGNRIQEDPSADPEQDIFGFVAEGIDHAGLLALRVPRPTLLGAARFDFFPIEGARETFAEANRLYEVAGAGDRIAMAEAAERHGLTLPLRTAVYHWFDRWLAGRGDAAPVVEAPVAQHSDRELLVCAEGQVNRSLRSRPMLPMAWEEFDRKPKPPRGALRDLLGLDPDQAAPRVTEIVRHEKIGQTLVVLVNGNESLGWNEEMGLIKALEGRGHTVVMIDPRGVGQNRPKAFAQAPHYADPLSGVEENIAYNAFLVGKSVLGLRVSDVKKALETLIHDGKPSRLILCGRRDAALVACLAAAIEPRVDRVACEDMLLSFRTLFAPEGFPINAASILPGLLQRFGDVAEILAQVAPRKVLVAAGIGDLGHTLGHVQTLSGRFSAEPRLLLDALRD
jgi:cephalosporin-C deacetylase-like acetyl esterase